VAEGRGGLLSAGGILNIIVGAFEIALGGILLAANWLNLPLWTQGFPGFRDFPGFRHVFSMADISSQVSIIGIIFLVLGIIAVVGGIFAVKRSSFGLSLAGAICALPSGTLGILAIIFISLSKGEFEVSY